MLEWNAVKMIEICLQLAALSQPVSNVLQTLYIMKWKKLNIRYNQMRGKQVEEVYGTYNKIKKWRGDEKWG